MFQEWFRGQGRRGLMGGGEVSRNRIEQDLGTKGKS